VLGRIAQIAVTAHDPERATAFYRDTLGMQHLFSVPGMAFFEHHGVRLMLARPEAAHDHPASILYYEVPDIRAAHDMLRSRGVRFVDEPHVVAPLGAHDLWMTFFHDSEGNTLALTSLVRRS
jgi:methylmalonyl-CoA/ethylmalonyl-CoA epimerase